MLRLEADTCNPRHSRVGRVAFRESMVFSKEEVTIHIGPCLQRHQGHLLQRVAGKATEEFVEELARQD